MIKMSKKAALELSINAIVIIIIAIVMLALGLGFVRMLFGGATTRFAAIIEQEPEPQAPSSVDIITLSRGLVMTAPGKAEVVKISVYNPTNWNWAGGSCSGTALDCSSIPDLTSCGNQLGCSWTTNCGGTVTDCLDITTMSACNAQLVVVGTTTTCIWTPGSGVNPEIKCSSDVNSTAFITNVKIIIQGSYETYDALFTIKKDVPQPSTHLCEIEIMGYSKDFTISVK